MAVIFIFISYRAFAIGAATHAARHSAAAHFASPKRAFRAWLRRQQRDLSRQRTSWLASPRIGDSIIRRFTMSPTAAAQNDGGVLSGARYRVREFII